MIAAFCFVVGLIVGVVATARFFLKQDTSPQEWFYD